MAKLKIYTDENVNVRVAQGLRRRGVKAFSALEKEMVGCKDKEHFEYAIKNNAVIFTHDHHFIKIAQESTEKAIDHCGVIFVEINKLGLGECIRRLSLFAEIIPSLKPKELIRVLEKGGCRFFASICAQNFSSIWFYC